MSMPAAAQAPEATVSRWMDAFNAGDVDAMVACLDPHVALQPLRLYGLDHAYHGHDGIRAWFVQLRQLGHQHHIVITDIHATGVGHVLASGALTTTDQADLGPFCGLHRLVDGLIVAAHHYISDPDMLERLGLVAAATRSPPTPDTLEGFPPRRWLAPRSGLRRQSRPM
jgi:ketosteroid isomerase-like protein